MDDFLRSQLEKIVGFLFSALQEDSPWSDIGGSRSLSRAVAVAGDLCGRSLFEVPARFRLALESCNRHSFDRTVVRAWHDLLRGVLCFEFGVLTPEAPPAVSEEV